MIDPGTINNGFMTGEMIAQESLVRRRAHDGTDFFRLCRPTRTPRLRGDLVATHGSLAQQLRFHAAGNAQYKKPHAVSNYPIGACL